MSSEENVSGFFSAELDDNWEALEGWLAAGRSWHNDFDSLLLHAACLCLHSGDSDFILSRGIDSGPNVNHTLVGVELDEVSRGFTIDREFLIPAHLECVEGLVLTVENGLRIFIVSLDSDREVPGVDGAANLSEGQNVLSFDLTCEVNADDVASDRARLLRFDASLGVSNSEGVTFLVRDLKARMPPQAEVKPVN